MPSTEVMQERVATPSTCTVQAPTSAMLQPNFVPVMPSTSRNTHKSGVSPSTSTARSTPLTLIVIAIAALPARRVGPLMKREVDGELGLHTFVSNVIYAAFSDIGRGGACSASVSWSPRAFG